MRCSSATFNTEEPQMISGDVMITSLSCIFSTQHENACSFRRNFDMHTRNRYSCRSYQLLITLIAQRRRHDHSRKPEPTLQKRKVDVLHVRRRARDLKIAGLFLVRYTFDTLSTPPALSREDIQQADRIIKIDFAREMFAEAIRKIKNLPKSS